MNMMGKRATPIIAGLMLDKKVIYKENKTISG
jgi:hypothetical protein